MANMTRAQLVETLASIGIESEPEMTYPGTTIVIPTFHVWTQKFARGCGHESKLGIVIGDDKTETAEDVIALVERCKSGKCVDCWTSEYAAAARKSRRGRRR